MPASYSIALNRAGINTANSPMIEFRASASARMKINEIGVTVQTAPTTAPRFFIARSTNTPTGGTTNTPIADDAADGASLSSILVPSWTLAPTFATSGPWIRTLGIPVTVGGSFIWTFPTPIIIPLSGSLVFGNLNASGATVGAFDIYANWNE